MDVVHWTCLDDCTWGECPCHYSWRFPGVLGLARSTIVPKIKAHVSWLVEGGLSSSSKMGVRTNDFLQDIRAVWRLGEEV